MSVNSLLTHWRSEPTIFDNISYWRVIPPRSPSTEAIPIEIQPALRTWLADKGINSLYSHQATAWNSLIQGRNPIIVTGTASGKTLAYNLPILNQLINKSQSRALYIFPTKALAQDQLSTLRSMVGNDDHSKICPSVYDGDTPTSHRHGVRSNSRLIITNPDMLHTGILPHHTSWIDFLSNLKFIVIDEMHIYRGVFGSHVANVIRRLKRVCSHYASSPQFILTSATIANPVELAGKLIEADVDLISDDGSSRGQRNFLVYNPPLVDPGLGLRRSALQEATRLADDLVTYDVQSVLFGRSRRSVEIMLTYLQERLPQKSSRGYRSGYLPSTRREIESGLRQGTVHAVVATTALELGIDIGGLGASVLVGYPGSIAATMQQAGRAGRGELASLSVLITTADPLDQYLARFPQYLIDTPPEQALINPDNALLLLNHLRCAAFELPFAADDGFGSVTSEILQEYLEYLIEDGVLHLSGGKYYWMADQYPAQGISLRSASPNQVVLTVYADDQPSTLGQIDLDSAYWMVHPQAIYLHEGRSYEVDSLDLEQGIAALRPIDCDYYTEAQQDTQVVLIECKKSRSLSAVNISFGDLQVTSRVTGYRKIRWHTHETLGYGSVELPPRQLLTTGYWLAISQETVNNLNAQGLWTDNQNDYGPHWSSIRESVRRRDGYRCQVCGAVETGRNHDVHHKVPFRSHRDSAGVVQRDHANRLENLITVCQHCHRQIELAVRIRSGLSGLAYSLGHLSPLLVMCDWRDLGIHADPQSTLADGSPVVVIYDQVPAGIGLSERLYDLHELLISETLNLVSTCPCEDGCPSCVGPGGESGSGSKLETLAIIKELSRK